MDKKQVNGSVVSGVFIRIRKNDTVI
jgi:hypothetical protein